MAVEESLRADIRELRSALSVLSGTLNTLSAALTKDSEVAKMQILAASQRVDSLEKIVTEVIDKLGEPQGNLSQAAVNKVFYAICGLGGILIWIGWMIANGGGA